MIDTIKIFSKCTGINNKVDPKRLNEKVQETGSADLAEGINIDIDDTGMISCRPGQVRLTTVRSHSVFCDKGDAFVVQDGLNDAAIYKINPNFSLTGVRSGMTIGARVSFCQVGTKTYYMNGVESGVIEDAISTPWPVHTHIGVSTLKEFYPAPIGTHIAYWDGRMWIVVDSTVYVSEQFQVGSFRLAGRGFSFPSDIKMIKPVNGGMWVSDSEKIGFIARADNFEHMKWKKKASFPAHEWSENIELVDLSQSALQVPGLSAIWSSDAGLCIGTEDGQLIVATEAKLIYPTGAMGATVVEGHNVINSVY